MSPLSQGEGIATAGRDKEKEKYLSTLGAHVDCYNLYGKKMKFSKDVKSRTTIYPAKSLLGIVLKEMKSASHKDICALVFIVALFSIAKRFKQH